MAQGHAPAPGVCPPDLPLQRTPAIVAAIAPRAWPALLLGYLAAGAWLIHGQALPLPWGVLLLQGVGALWCVAALQRGGQLGPHGTLLRQPLRHGAVALGLGLAAWWGLSRLAGLAPLPWPPGTGLGANAPWVALGGMLEEWIFRAALLWHWLGASPAEPFAWRPDHAGWRAAGKVVVLAGVFAALHAPQGWPAVLVALGGALALSLLMLWRRSLVLVAVLHALFNLALPA